MARKNGFYKVRHHGKEKIMKWTTTNDDNTHEISGYWNGDNGYSGNDHDMDFVSEKILTDKEVMSLIFKGSNEVKKHQTNYVGIN